MKIYAYLSKKYYAFLKNKNKRYLQKLVHLGLNLGENVSIVAIHTCLFDPSHCFLISIGDNCTIAPGVRLIAHDASTKQYLGYTKIGKITICENCFIGDSVTILPCVTIGAGSIIGAGAVVTKDVPAGMVAAGNPAQVLCALDVYLEKIKKLAEKKTIFNDEYLIQNLNAIRRNEILKEVDSSIGFIL